MTTGTPAERQQARNYKDQGGALWVVRGKINIDSPGTLCFDGVEFSPTKTVRIPLSISNVHTLTAGGQVDSKINGTTTPSLLLDNPATVDDLAATWIVGVSNAIVTEQAIFPSDYNPSLGQTLDIHVLSAISGNSDATIMTVKFVSPIASDQSDTVTISGTTITDRSVTLTAPTTSPAPFSVILTPSGATSTDNLLIYAIWVDVTYTPA